MDFGEIFWTIVVALLALWLLPLAFIWAINTLFTLTIAYSTLNWFCALVIMLLLGGGRSRKSR
jgi:hypothetical protein